MHWEGHNITYVEFPPKMFTLNLVIRKQLDKSKLRDITQNNWSRLFKNVNILKDPKKLRNNSRLKEIQDIWQLNAMCEPWLDPKQRRKDSYKGHYWGNWNKHSVLDNSIVPMLNFLRAIIILCLYKQMSSTFSGNMCWNIFGWKVMHEAWNYLTNGLVKKKLFFIHTHLLTQLSNIPTSWRNLKMRGGCGRLLSVYSGKFCSGKDDWRLDTSKFYPKI